MPTFRITAPDGRTFDVTGPEGSTAEQALAQVQSAQGKKKEAPPIAGGVDPSGGFGENLLAGVGSGMTSVVRALGGGKVAESMGLPGTKEEAERLDAPLSATAGGKIGQVVGVAAPAALAIPFTPLTYGGAAAAGAITGGALTEGGVGDRATGAGLGALGGLAGQALPAVYRAGKGVLQGLAEPFMQGGRDRIAGRAIQRFSTNPNALQGLTNAPTATGALPTLAEAARDPGLATLERAIGTLDPQAAAALAERGAANNAARIEALRSVSGGATRPTSSVRRLNQIANGQPTREAAEATRSAAASRSYGEAMEAGIDPDIAYAMAPQLNSLLERPSVRAGIARARTMAAEDGVDIADPGSVQGLHYLKQALDDQVGRLRDQPTRQRLVQQTSRDLASVLEEIAPLYQTARREFQNNSVAVNRAAVGERLTEKASGAIRDFGGNRRLQANAFSRALNDEGELIRQSTGFRGGPSSLEDLLSPTQFGRVGAVRSELETLANLSNAANGAGSQTAKMLASQNLLRQIAGPLGLPESFVDSVLSQTLMRPVQWGMQAAEPRIQDAIARGLLGPEEGLRMIAQARAADAVTPPNALQQLVRRSVPAAMGALSANGSR